MWCFIYITLHAILITAITEFFIARNVITHTFMPDTILWNRSDINLSTDITNVTIATPVTVSVFLNLSIATWADAMKSFIYVHSMVQSPRKLDFHLSKILTKIMIAWNYSPFYLSLLLLLTTLDKSSEAAIKGNYKLFAK